MNTAHQELLAAAQALNSDDSRLQAAIAAVEALPATSAEQVLQAVVAALEAAGYTVTAPAPAA